MKRSNIGILTGVTLSLLLGSVAIAPAQANVRNRCLAATQEADKIGTVKSVIGDKVLIELDDPQASEERFSWVGSSKQQLGALNIIEGMKVCLADLDPIDQYAIVGVASPVDIVESQETASRASQLRFTSTGSTIPTPPPRQQTTVRPTPTAAPIPAAPIPGLW